MSIAAVIKEINSVTSFFGNSKIAGDVIGLQRSFADGVLNKLKQLKVFSVSDGSQVYEALAGDPFGDVQTERIKEAVNALLQKGASTPPETTKGSSQHARCDVKQTLKHWWNYFLQDEIDYMKSADNSFHSKMTLFVERSMTIGCTKPTEETLKWGLAMLLLCHYRQVPKPRDIYDKLQDFKRAFVAEARPFFFDHLEEFPAMPEHLPGPIFAHAYKQWTPVCIQFAGINTVADSIPLRSNSKLLKKGKSKAEVDALDAAFGETDDVSPSKRTHVKHEPADSPKATRVKHEPDLADSDDDPEVILLKQEYALKLAQLKAKKRMAAKHEPAELSGRVLVDRKSDGSLQIMTKKLETPVKYEPTEAEPPAPNEADLDPYTKAALAAMEARHAKKNDQKKGAACKRPACSDAAGEHGTNDATRSKLSAAPTSTSMKKCVPAKAKKEPAKAKKEPKAEPTTKTEPKGKAEPKRKAAADDDEVPKSKIHKAMPALPKDGSSPKPVKYWGGIIYTAAKAKKFRALKVRGNPYTEASASWGGDKPTKEAWTKCVKAIEEHHQK